MVANICACLPVYKPLWKSIGRLSERLLKLYNSMSASSLLPSFVRRNKVKENNPEDPKAEEFFISLKGVPVSKFGSLGGTGNSEKPGGPSIVSTIAEERDMVRRYPNFDV